MDTSTYLETPIDKFIESKMQMQQESPVDPSTDYNNTMFRNQDNMKKYMKYRGGGQAPVDPATYGSYGSNFEPVPSMIYSNTTTNTNGSDLGSAFVSSYGEPIIKESRQSCSQSQGQSRDQYQGQSRGQYQDQYQDQNYLGQIPMQVPVYIPVPMQGYGPGPVVPMAACSNPTTAPPSCMSQTVSTTRGPSEDRRSVDGTKFAGGGTPYANAPPTMRTFPTTMAPMPNTDTGYGATTHPSRGRRVIKKVVKPGEESGEALDDGDFVRKVRKVYLKPREHGGAPGAAGGTFPTTGVPSGALGSSTITTGPAPYMGTQAPSASPAAPQGAQTAQQPPAQQLTQPPYIVQNGQYVPNPAAGAPIAPAAGDASKGGATSDQSLAMIQDLKNQMMQQQQQYQTSIQDMQKKMQDEMQKQAKQQADQQAAQQAEQQVQQQAQMQMQAQQQMQQQMLQQAQAAKQAQEKAQQQEQIQKMIQDALGSDTTASDTSTAHKKSQPQEQPTQTVQQPPQQPTVPVVQPATEAPHIITTAPINLPLNSPVVAVILRQPAFVGDTKLVLDTPPQARIGMDILIDQGDNQEKRRITALGSFILDLPLAMNHPIGTIITVYQAGGAPTPSVATAGPVAYNTPTPVVSSLPVYTTQPVAQAPPTVRATTPAPTTSAPTTPAPTTPAPTTPGATTRSGSTTRPK